MRITPAKWDAEYAWLRSEEGVRATMADPKVKVPKEERARTNWKTGRPTALGVTLQALGVIFLGLLAINGHLISLLPLAALVGGEVIFISSLEHRGKRSAGDH